MFLANTTGQSATVAYLVISRAGQLAVDMAMDTAVGSVEHSRPLNR